MCHCYFKMTDLDGNQWEGVGKLYEKDIKTISQLSILDDSINFTSYLYVSFSCLGVWDTKSLIMMVDVLVILFMILFQITVTMQNIYIFQIVKGLNIINVWPFFCL